MMNKTHLRPAALQFVCSCAALLMLGTAQAATLVVDSTQDPGLPNDSSCTLREAVAAINNLADDAADCTAAGSYGSDDRIDLTGLSGDIQLLATAGEIDITQPMTLTGPGADQLTVHGNKLIPASRIFNIGSNAATTLVGLHLADGATTGSQQAGGAVLSYSNLTVRNCAFTGNSTQGVESYGGAIAVVSIARLTNTTVSGNQTGGATAGGGGVAAAGGLVLTNSTVSGNHTSGLGAKGGGVIVVGNVLINNSTLANNSAASAVDGISVDTGSSGFFIVNNTIIAQAGAAAGETACNRKVDAGNNNLATDTSCTGVAATASSINLGPLANNGGSTQTHALQPGSAAIDAGKADICADASLAGQDQRGITRPQDGDGDGNAVCDIGSYELVGSSGGGSSSGGSSGGSSSGGSSGSGGLGGDGGGGCSMAPQGHNGLGALLLLVLGAGLWRCQQRIRLGRD